MTSLRVRVQASTCCISAFVLVVFSLFAGPAFAQAQTSNRPGQPLDGMRFKATIVKDAHGDAPKQPLIDELDFHNGNFSSAICKRFNFTEAPYWVRMESGRVRFMAELQSPTDGTMLWKGTVEGGVLNGTMRWTKKRWYWTIDAEHKIRGEIDNTDPAASPAK